MLGSTLVTKLVLKEYQNHGTVDRMDQIPPVRSRLKREAVWQLALCSLLGWGVYAHAAAIPDIDRAELLSWADAQSALRLLDEITPAAQSGKPLAQFLMVRGLADADVGGEQAPAIIQRLHELGRSEPSAEAAAHIVQANLFLHDDKFDRVATELKPIEADTTLPAFEQFRLQQLRGYMLMLTGHREDALSAYEKALDLAQAMQSVPRAIEAMIKLSALFINTGNPERADALIARARAAAQKSGDEITLGEISTLESESADIRGDRAAERRALVEALGHAQRIRSDRLLTLVSIDSSESYLKTADYAVALRFAKQALLLARKLRRAVLERVATFDMAMAQIGLGHLVAGKALADGVIQQGLESGDLVSTDDLMRQYWPTLERAGDFRGALRVYHREDTLHEQLMTTARAKAMLELSAKVDDERRARQIELLERDSAIKSADLQAQRFRQQQIVMAIGLIVLTCGALAWGIGRIRKVNARLVHNSRHDALTGLLNRRYFNEYILTQRGEEPYLGGLMLVDIDHLQHINDIYGHSAGDQVLKTFSERVANILVDSDALVRWGGEEFLCLLAPMSNARLSLAVRRLLVALRDKPVIWNGENIPCTISVGYASFSAKGSNVNFSLNRAIALVKKALGQAKLQGCDRSYQIEPVDVAGEQSTRFVGEEVSA
jgi:diguanylate cyclase (GGDEF)-like protein